MRRTRDRFRLAKLPVSAHFAGGAALALAAIIASCSDGRPASPRGGPLAGSTSSGGGPGGSTVVGAGGETETPVGRSLRRLSQREYNNVVHDLLGDTTQPANGFGGEVYVNGFDNGSDGLTVQGTDVINFQAAAEALAASAVANSMTTLIGSCDPTKDAAACESAFFSTFAQKAYRRPLTPTELGRLQSLYTTGAADGGFSGGIQLALEGILQSPAFLYREELGASDPSLPSGVVRLTDYEVASELSFLLTGSTPDDTLLAAAAGGTLKTTDDFAREATRLIGLAGARPSFRSFLHQWMATDQVASVNKDTTIYPNFVPAMGISMSAELDHFYDQVLWGGTASLRELFTSTTGFVDSTLAPLYGVKASGSGLTQVTLDAKTREGVMTRAGFLAAHADTDSSGPIPRGVFVLGAILCAAPNPPPANVPAAPPASGAVQAHQTTRQRFTAHLNQSFCADCHGKIDGVGFGFEQFDGLGVYRTTENGSPVDTSGELVDTDVDGAFVGASALAEKLVTSKQVAACFVRQVYRFAMGQEESAGNAALLTSLGTGFDADARMTNVFSALVADPAFVLRSTSMVNP